MVGRSHGAVPPTRGSLVGTGRGRNRGLQGEGTGKAGGPVVGRGRPRILNMGIQKLTKVILTALILVLGMYN